jgi:hypothetical protein
MPGATGEFSSDWQTPSEATGLSLRSGAVTRALVPLVAALALAFGAFACGDDDSEEFKEDYNRVVRPLSTLGDDVAASLATAPERSDRENAARFDELADRSERARQRVAGLEPPEDAQEEFDELLALLKQGVADLRAVARAARESDPPAAEEATQDLVETGQRVREAEEEFKDAVG